MDNITIKILQELLERMEALENTMGIINSELYHFRNVYFKQEDLDAMGNPNKQKWLERIRNAFK